jgi:hypothetical protein
MIRTTSTAGLFQHVVVWLRRTGLGEARVRTSVWSGMFHVWHLLAGILPEADQALRNALRFLEGAQTLTAEHEKQSRTTGSVWMTVNRFGALNALNVANWYAGNEARPAVQRADARVNTLARVD